MKDEKTYVGAAMFYDRFDDGEEAEDAARLPGAAGHSCQESLEHGTEMHGCQGGGDSSAARLVRAVTLRLGWKRPE